MKWTPKLFYVLGFIFEYVIPVLLFGLVTPLVHGKLDEGLTTVGVIAVAVLALILIGKIKSAVEKWEKGIVRAIILSFLKAVPLFIFAIFLRWLIPFTESLLLYMWRIIPMFILGCLFDTIGEYLDSKGGTP